jgi:hypothetical protein
MKSALNLGSAASITELPVNRAELMWVPRCVRSATLSARPRRFRRERGDDFLEARIAAQRISGAASHSVACGTPGQMQSAMQLDTPNTAAVHMTP